MTTKAILLVGGKGTRLAPLTNNTPKPMLKVAGKPVTEHQIIKARDAGITDLVLATSYFAEVFEPYFGDGSDFGISITYAVEKVPMGTGGAIANAAKKLKLEDGESVVIFNGDVLSGHDLRSQISLHEQMDADATLYLTKVADPRAYGCVPLDDQNRVTAFLEKMENPITDTINAGCYVFRTSALAQIPEQSVVSVERETFPKLLDNGKRLFGYLDLNYWIDMGTPQSFIRASRDLVLNPELSGATSGVVNQALIEDAVDIHPSALIDGGSVISTGASIGREVKVSGSIIGRDVRIGAGAQIIDSYISQGLVIESGQSINGEVL